MLHVRPSELLENFTSKAAGGISLDQSNILRALRFESVRDELLKAQDKNPEAKVIWAGSIPSTEAGRVTVSFVFAHKEDVQSLVVTFDHSQNCLTELTSRYGQDVRASDIERIPFFLRTPSFTESTAIPSDDASLDEVQNRRTAFLKELVSSTFDLNSNADPFFLPATATTVTTNYTTAGATTPNDSDEKSDSKTDDKTEN
ncbi:hypothetical protein [Microvirga sp. 2TAF3]|uniref:hypothetical protein n=1 Tax=Microvirga sp. 2TAF3 TaxID=3233014 RepID=UPI003F96BC30